MEWMEWMEWIEGSGGVDGAAGERVRFGGSLTCDSFAAPFPKPTRTDKHTQETLA